MKSKFLPALLISLCLFLFFFRLGDRPLRNPDEGRYAEVAREMVTSGNWIEPTLYGVDYLKKPPLFYWLIALSFKGLGFTEFAARLVPTLFGLLGVLGTFFFVRKTTGEKEAWMASALLATNVWYLQVSRYLVIDAVFSFFLVACLYLFFLAMQPGVYKKVFYGLFYLSMGLAMLTKGPTAPVVLVLCLGSYLVLRRRFWEVFREAEPVLGLALVGLVTAPWFVLISSRKPEFFSVFLLQEHFQRFSSKGFEHQEPFYYYFAALPLMFFPWGLFLKPLEKAVGLVKKNASSPDLYLLVCAATLVLFYSLSSSKLPTYMLPCIPLLSIPLAKGWARLMEEGSPKTSRTTLLSVVSLVLLMAACLAVVVAPAYSKDWFRRLPEEARPGLFAILLSFFSTSFLAMLFLSRRQWQRLFITITLCLGLVSLPVSSMMRGMNRDYTTCHFAQVLKPLLGPDDKVYIYEHPGAFYDFAFYLDRPVKLVGLGGELEISKTDEKAREHSLDFEEFFEQVRSNISLYCLMRRSDFDGLPQDVRSALHALHEDHRKVLTSTVSINNS